MSSSINVTSLTLDKLQALAQISDSTRGDVFQDFKGAVAQIQSLTTAATPDPQKLKDNATLLIELLTLGTTLIVDPSNPSVTKKYYLTTDMAKQLEPLLQSLTAAGIEYNQSGVPELTQFGAQNVTQEKVDLWQALVTQPLYLNSTGQPVSMLDTLFTYASTVSNRSIQALVELEYVKTGNDLLSEQLEDLENALKTSKSILDTLTDLQAAHNHITFPPKPPFSQVFNLKSGTSLSAFSDAYTKAASAYYGTPVTPVVDLFPVKSVIATIPPAAGTYGTTAVASVYEYMNFKTDVTNVIQHVDFSNSVLVVPAGLAPAGWAVAEGTPLYDLYSFSGQVYRNAVISGLTLPGSGPVVLMRKPTEDLNANEFTTHTQTSYGITDVFATVTIPTADDLTVPTEPKPTNYTNIWSGFKGVMIPTTMTAADIADLGTIRTDNANQYSGIYQPNDFLHFRRNIIADYSVFSKLSANISEFNTVDPLGDFIFGASNILNTAYDFNLPDGPANRSIQLFAYFENFAQKKIFFTRVPSGVQFLQTDFDNLSLGIKQAASFIPIKITSGDDAIELKDKIVDLFHQISAGIRDLQAINPDAATDEASLLRRLQAVYNDLKTRYTAPDGSVITKSTSLASALAGLKNWMLDSYEKRNVVGETGAGAIQQNITFAITSSQSLNDSQKEKVRRFLFVFEEYYKSASAILQKLTQILERVAQGISR